MPKEKPKFKIEVGQIYKYTDICTITPSPSYGVYHMLIVRKSVYGRFNCLCLTSSGDLNCTVLPNLTDGVKISRFLDDHCGELVAHVDKIVEFLEAN